MDAIKVITNFSPFADAELDKEALNAVKACTGNANFKFSGTSLADFTTAENDYHEAMGNIKTGDHQAITAKNNAREVLEKTFSAIAKQVNDQSGGDLLILESSSITLAKTPEHHQQPQPSNFKIANSDNGTMRVSVKKSPVGSHGVVFAYTPVTGAPADINKWTLQPSTKRSAVIKGLTGGIHYFFAAAYKGLDTEDLVWTLPIDKIVGN